MDVLTPEQRRRAMQANGPRWTAPEIRLVDACLGAGLVLYFDELLPGRPDFLLTAQGARPVAVFMHGCFWHGCPQHFKAPATNLEMWRTKIENNRRRHERVARRLRAMGWRSRVVWEHEVYQSLGRAVDRLKAAIGER